MFKESHKLLVAGYVLEVIFNVELVSKPDKLKTGVFLTIMGTLSEQLMTIELV